MWFSSGAAPVSTYILQNEHEVTSGGCIIPALGSSVAMDWALDELLDAEQSSPGGGPGGGPDEYIDHLHSMLTRSEEQNNVLIIVVQAARHL